MGHTAAIFLCGGKSTRMGEAIADKVRLTLAGKPIWEHSLEAFRTAEICDIVVWVTRDRDQETQMREALAVQADVPWEQYWVRGGAERQNSVFAGLSALPFPTDFVFIHDMARPCIQPDILVELLHLARTDGSAVLARRITDTIREGPPDGSLPRQANTRTLDRNRLWAMETPQVFKMELILPAYQAVIRDGAQVTDDAAALEYRNLPVSLFENPYSNPKLTRPADIPYVESILTRIRDQNTSR